MKKNEIMDRLAEMENKYFDLVWVARKRKEDIPVAGKGMARVKKAYPKECKELTGKDGQWHHGFNSGCLAGFRFALGLMGDAADAHMAEENFPFLDT
jgi:hypothetical protein